MRKAEEQNSPRSEAKEMDTTQSLDSFVLGPGRQIGPFRIEQELGRGAMGIVYLAHDVKLDRPVAIKSLPVELLEDTKARTLFTREARVLASLNHPNIATIYEELQEAEGVGYLVLEYIPGQTLAEHTARAKLKPLEALSIAQQIAEAVAAAHEHGVIHRDLKPGNIKITPDGRIKVLDFGLAKALGAKAADQKSTVTEPGRVMGTPAYMSPEQARGQEADERCDIWSFGCVLYEMLTGKVPFEGDTVSDTLAGVLDREPDWHALPRATPTNIRVLLRRCLKKDRRGRLHDIVDAVLEISETLSGVLETVALSSEVVPVSRLLRRDIILVALAFSIVGILVAGAVLQRQNRPQRPGTVSRLAIQLPADKPLYSGRAPNCFLAISPDGTRLVYVGKLDGPASHLYVRSIDSLEIKPIPGTKNAHNPFFSPNGQWVGFFTKSQLKKVALAGGQPSTLHEDVRMGDTAFGSWAKNGTIVFSVCRDNCGLQQISENGGQHARTLVAPASVDSQSYYCYPQILPEGNAILYSHVDSNDPRSSHIEAFLPKTRVRKVVLHDASYARYVNSGHLIFVRNKAMMASPFDAETLEPTGLAVPLVVDDVRFDWTKKTPQITISRNGTFVYIAESEHHQGERRGELGWVDREGQFTSLDAAADVYEGPRLSPDGRLIAVGIRSKNKDNSQSEGHIRVNVYNVQRGTSNPLLTEGESRYPQWSQDSSRIAFWGWANKSEQAAVFCKTVGASAPAEWLANKPASGEYLHPYAWSRNLLACTVLDPNTQEDIWVIETDDPQEPKPVLCTEYMEYNPTFSPDGHWLAYVSEKSGQPKIYLREYPKAQQEWIVETPGATNPVWSHDATELYYISGNRMMAVTVTSELNFPIGKPQPLFELPDVVVSGGSLQSNYDVSKDGRFLMVKWSDDAKDQLICVQHWFEELKQLAPHTKK